MNKNAKNTQAEQDKNALRAIEEQANLEAQQAAALENDEDTGTENAAAIDLEDDEEVYLTANDLAKQRGIPGSKVRAILRPAFKNSHAHNEKWRWAIDSPQLREAEEVLDRVLGTRLAKREAAKAGKKN